MLSQAAGSQLLLHSSAIITTPEVSFLACILWQKDDISVITAYLTLLLGSQPNKCLQGQWASLCSHQRSPCSPPLYYPRVKWLCGTLSQPGPPRVLIAAPLGKPPYPHGPTKHHYTPLQTVLTRAGELRRAKEVVCILLYLLLITTRRN